MNGPAFNFGYAGESFGRSAGFFNVRPDASAVAPNPSLRFMTGNVQRMIITNLGLVGIGAPTPFYFLDVRTTSGTALSGISEGSGGTGIQGLNSQGYGVYGLGSIGVWRQSGRRRGQSRKSFRQSRRGL